MTTRPILRLLAVALIVAPGARLLASLESEADALSARNYALNLLEQGLRESSDREAARAGHKEAAAKPSPLSAVNFDVNKDGKLDEAEFAKWSAAVRLAVVKSAEAMKRFDKNSDGKLDDAEWAAAGNELFGVR